MIENLFSVILYFSLGYITRKIGLFNEEKSKVLIDFILYISFPALVIYNVYYLRFGIDIVYVLITGWLVIVFSILFSFIVGKFLKLDRNRLAAFVMMSSFGNTSFLGFPYQLAFFGEEVSYGSGKGANIDIKKALIFPPFVVLILSLLIKPINLEIPEFILRSLNMLGLTVIPLALFSVGTNLKFSNLRKEKNTIALVLLIKMIIVPICVVFLLKFLGIEFSTVWKSGILEIAMPPMVLASILVMGSGLNKDIATGSVAIGIILSFLTVPLIVYIMEYI